MNRLKKRYMSRLILIVLLGMVINETRGQGSSRYDIIYDQLMTINESQVLRASISNYTLEHKAARFNLKEGNIFLLAPVDNRRIAAVFKGDGSFWFSPPTQIERDQLFRFYDTDTLEQEFKYLFLLFFDQTADDLQSQLTFEIDSASDEVDDLEKELEDIYAYISDEDTRYFRTDILKFILEDDSSGYFYAHFYDNFKNPMMYEFNPYEPENIRFMHRADLGHIYKVPEVVCQFTLDEQKNKIFERDFSIEKFNITTTIKSDLDFSAQAVLDIRINRDNQNWLAFNIYSDMEIDSVYIFQGKALEFFKPEETIVFWVESDRLLKRGDTVKLVIDYHCDDILHRDSRSWIYLKSPNYWYPRNAIWDLAGYDLTFHYPENMTLVSIGNQVSVDVRNNIQTANWRPKGPVTHAAFNAGFFESFRVENDSLVDGITVLKTKQGLLFRTRDIEEDIAKDVERSIKFYAQHFGDVPFDGLYVGEVPFPHGMAFKGMLNLAWSTFYQTDNLGYDQVFRAHEVAHQWWGIEVGFDTYHDQWLSESFSEFSGIWYLQQLEDGVEMFNDMMEEWQEDILTNREYMFAKGQESGPIWLGVRTSSTQTTGDYDLIVYKKGAWVLHMLRMMMYDWQNKSDVRFTKLIRDYYLNFKGKKASTEDFQHMVEKHFEKPMDGFFQQWIYGTEIPRYTYAYEIVNTDENNIKLRIIIKQDDTQKLFAPLIPVQVIYDDETSEYFMVEHDQRMTTREFELNSEPDEIIINPMHAVLADWDEVDMDEILTGDQ